MSHVSPAIGMPILYFPAGSGTPFAGTIAGIETDGRINIAYSDAQGRQQSRQGVPFGDGPNPGGDYVVANLTGDATAAIAAHAKAMKDGFQGVPTTGNMAAGASNIKPPVGVFTSAALMPGNRQQAGSGGPFDPANTSKAQMSAHQTLESESVGNPTTGGVTPKLSAANMHNLSERDRETAAAIVAAKSPDEKVRLAAMGTGAATPGSAQMIVDELAKPGEHPPPAQTQMPSGPNAELDRIEREERQHDEAVEQSKAITAARKKDASLTAGPNDLRKQAAKSLEEANKGAAQQAQRAAAKTPAGKHLPAQKEPKKAPVKVAAKKNGRTRR